MSTLTDVRYAIGQLRGIVDDKWFHHAPVLDRAQRALDAMERVEAQLVEQELPMVMEDKVYDNLQGYAKV